MAKRSLDVLQQLKNFENEVMKQTDQKDFHLKDGLLVYIRNADRMGLPDNLQQVAYIVGLLIGPADGTVELTGEQYDSLKKLADNGKINNPNGQTESIYNLEIRMQIKEMVDSAPVVSELVPLSPPNES